MFLSANLPYLSNLYRLDSLMILADCYFIKLWYTLWGTVLPELNTPLLLPIKTCQNFGIVMELTDTAKYGL